MPGWTIPLSGYGWPDSIATRSGTNTFHGTLFEYFRNTVLDARDWFVNANGLPKPQELQNDFGGVIGGPVQKDKTFFFFSYEGLRLRQPSSMQTVVPDNASRTELRLAPDAYSAAARFHGLQNIYFRDPGARAPGFMLTPASQAEAQNPYPSKELRANSLNSGIPFSEKPIAYVCAKTLLHVSSRRPGNRATPLKDSYRRYVRIERYAAIRLLVQYSALAGRFINKSDLVGYSSRVLDAHHLDNHLRSSCRESVPGWPD